MKVLDAVNRDWPIAMEVRKLQSRLWRLSRKHHHKIILVTSAVGGEGKTTTTAFLAATLAMHAGRRILAVDFDLRRPNLHTHFDAERAPGLAEVLEGRATIEQAVRTTSLEGLDVLLAGDAEDSPSLLLDSPRVGALLEQMRPRYDLILLDSPPLVPVADTSGLLPLTDGVLLVVMSGKTPRPLLQRARELILGMGGNILGLVVGNAQEAAPEAYSDSYYYSYTSGKSGKGG